MFSSKLQQAIRGLSLTYQKHRVTGSDFTLQFYCNVSDFCLFYLVFFFTTRFHKVLWVLFFSPL